PGSIGAPSTPPTGSRCQRLVACRPSAPPSLVRRFHNAAPEFRSLWNFRILEGYRPLPTGAAVADGEGIAPPSPKQAARGTSETNHPRRRRTRRRNTDPPSPTRQHPLHTVTVIKQRRLISMINKRRPRVLDRQATLTRPHADPPVVRPAPRPVRQPVAHTGSRDRNRHTPEQGVRRQPASTHLVSPAHRASNPRLNELRITRTHIQRHDRPIRLSQH